MRNSTGEKGYPLLFFRASAKWRIGLLVTFLVIGISGGFYFWYSQNSNDAAPDSIAGLGYAILGIVFLLLAAVLYSIRRRSRNKRALGQLNNALNWHIFFAIIGLALLFMHSFGNFNPRSGTYALFGLIALVISGFVGRALDHLMPRLIAREAQKALTVQGEDRIETISLKLQAIVAHNTESLYGLHVGPDLSQPSPIYRPPSSETQDPSRHLEPDGAELAERLSILRLPSSQTQDSSDDSKSSKLLTSTASFDFEERPLHTPWDLAYISLEATPQELSRIVGQHRFVPDKQSVLTRPGALMPGAQEQISELQEVQRAMQREQFYRYIIRYWRLFHIALALLTLGLITWHIVYAVQLLLH